MNKMSNPVVCAVVRLTLTQFIVMVGELEVHPSRVYSEVGKLVGGRGLSVVCIGRRDCYGIKTSKDYLLTLEFTSSSTVHKN